MGGKGLVFLLVGAGLGASVAFSIGAPAQLKAAGQPAPTLEGSWIQEQPAPGVGLAFLYTFSADGTHILTNTNHRTISPGHGVWMRTGDRQFAATQWHLRLDAEGNFVGYTKAWLDITLSETGDEFTARLRRDYTDTQWNPVNIAYPTASARRLRVEGFPG